MSRAYRSHHDASRDKVRSNEKIRSARSMSRLLSIPLVLSSRRPGNPAAVPSPPLSLSLSKRPGGGGGGGGGGASPPPDLAASGGPAGGEAGTEGRRRPGGGEREQKQKSCVHVVFLK
jgi:hypothetical protein